MRQFDQQALYRAAEQAMQLHKDQGGSFSWYSDSSYIEALNDIADSFSAETQVKILLLKRGLIENTTDAHFTVLTESGMAFTSFDEILEKEKFNLNLLERIDVLTEQQLQLRLLAEGKPWKAPMAKWGIVMVVLAALLSALFSWIFRCI